MERGRITNIYSFFNNVKQTIETKHVNEKDANIICTSYNLHMQEN